MKQSELIEGMIYVTGYSGQRGILLRKNVKKSYEARANYVEMQMVDDEGKPLLYEDTEWNQKYYPEKIGTPQPSKLLKPKDFKTIFEYEREKEILRKQAEERERRRTMVEEARAQMEKILVKAGLTKDDLYISASYIEDFDVAEISRVQVSGDSVNHMVAVFKAAGNGEG